MNNKILRIGIIAEYNPFHNGHIYQINWIKNQWNGAKIIVILSGNYVQRGEMAIADFETRKAICLNYGVDEVYELPFEYATQAAHIFAQGAIELAHQLKINKLVFGSESNDIDLFYKIAQAIYQDETKYYQLLRSELKQGISFPKANQIVLETIIGKSFVLPNDILGLEYVKAIVKNNYPIEAISMLRTVGFHSEIPDENIASASYIRKLIFEQNLDYQKYTPMVFEAIPDRIENYYWKFQAIVKNSSATDLAKIHLVSEGMEYLFKKHIDSKTYVDFIAACTSKRYPSSRIKRVLLYVLLQIKKDGS